ncbi:CDP-glycerol glycerophosphotransferase family protein [Heyndrickxia coagulans]|uniref:CDP-glycerol glycerophosphotransferase family protein n=1 Tax=Heyndrickxia coagulans TaxID=1398 RepID=A0AAW7CGC5_HEYCO|nr:CDP-glycerol glycerophosphotransferase family protein [Heyndrickxia coagulans]MDL5039894.1 CDP-glycerol glycerophosphotransferase family protein [Heyndrickxia coagulans]
MNTLKLLPTLLVKLLVRIAYRLCCLLPYRPDKITFASYRTDRLEGNLAGLYTELKKSYPGMRYIFLFKKMNATKTGKLSYVLHMLRACRHIATSAYFIIDDYYFPLYLIKRIRDTEVIQLWHAAGAFKKFGYSTAGKSFGPSEAYTKHVPIHSNYSKVVVSSSEVIPFYAEAFRMPEEDIVPLGLPRTDVLFRKENGLRARQKLFSRYPELRGKKLILYAPTFRGKSHGNTKTDIGPNFSAMKKRLGAKYALIVKLHPYLPTATPARPELSGFVYQLDEDFSTEEILLLSDFLITDYSSIIFDYSLLNRPIAFFAKDLDAYEQERGFYYDFGSFVPGPVFDRTESLAQWIQNGPYDLEKVQQFAQRFFDDFDGKAARRIAETLIRPRQPFEISGTVSQARSI